MANKTKTKRKTPRKPRSSTGRKKPSSKKFSSKRKTSGKKSPALKKKLGSVSKKKKTVVFIVSILVLFGIIAAAVSASNSGKRREITEIGKDTAWGIDISSHNGKIDWKRVSDNADFVFIRVGYRGYANGVIKADKNAKANLKGAKKYNIPAGAYFYSQAVNEKEAREEASFLLKQIKGYDVTLPLVIDFEHASSGGGKTGRLYNANLSKKENTAVINAFCERIRKAGYTPCVYASSYIFERHLNMKSIDDDVFIWVADYNEEITYSGYYDIWQYSEKGTCDGVGSRYVDTDYFYTKKRLG